MCIVIDTNVLRAVFNNESMNHDQFEPVYDWIMSKNGKVVFGGTKYLKEIGEGYRKLFIELNKMNSGVYIDNDMVDEVQRSVAAMILHPNFDDPHLVALLKVSECKLICSLDHRAFPYFKHSAFFTPAANRPRIYSQKVNRGLLKDKNIADICKPCKPMAKEAKKKIVDIIPNK